MKYDERKLKILGFSRNMSRLTCHHRVQPHTGVEKGRTPHMSFILYLLNIYMYLSYPD